MSTSRVQKKLDENNEPVASDTDSLPSDDKTNPASADLGNAADPFNQTALTDYKLNPNFLIYQQENAKSGSLGVVYEGFYCNQWVAVKRLELNKTQYKNDAEERFRIEISNNIEIQSFHPHAFVRFIGYIEAPLAILFEYCARGSLSDLLDDHSIPLPLSLRISFLIDVAAAMVLLHQIDWVHGDIKSANVMITADNKAKLGDFDLARLNGTPYQFGTPDYMAPEVEETGTSKETDVFSFGVLTWEVNERAIPSFSDETVRERIRRGERETMHKTPKALRNFTNLLWHHNPKMRLTAQQTWETLVSLKDQFKP